MNTKHYHSSALSALNLIKAKPRHTAEDAAKAFDAIRAVLLHAAQLSEELALKASDARMRRDATSMAIRMHAASGAAGQATSAAAQAPTAQFSNVA